MGYQAFALKYRPKIFDDVIGQNHIIAAIKAAVVNNRVHHAYLFSGPRGVGKTSVARILAKSLNCSQGVTITPCGTCVSCVEIAKNTSMDVIEIDGASNRGIDEIRSLRESVKLSPAYSMHKIYIIDEVHMLTNEAFNALLKTLEEPPAHVKFIFATTHPQKVLPTILSRCQKFQFNLVSVEAIVAKLKNIVSIERFKIDEGLFYAVARIAGGSFRDAESLLDQLAPIAMDKTIVDDVLSFLGIIDENTLNIAVTQIIDKDLSGALDLVEKITKDGKDLGVYVNSLIEQFRAVLLTKVSFQGFKTYVDLSPQTKQILIEVGKKISVPELLRIIDLLIEAKESAYKLNTARIPLEMALIKYAFQAAVPAAVKPQMKTLPQSQPSIQVQTSSAVKQAAAAPPQIKNEFDFNLNGLDMPSDESLQETKSAAKADILETNEDIVGADNVLFNEIVPQWQNVIKEIMRSRAAISAHLSAARPRYSRADVLTIAFAKKDKFQKESVEAVKDLQFIQEILSRVIGRNIQIRFVLVNDFAENQTKQEPVPLQKPAVDNIKTVSVNDDDFLTDLLDTFGGKFHTSD